VSTCVPVDRSHLTALNPDTRAPFSRAPSTSSSLAESSLATSRPTYTTQLRLSTLVDAFYLALSNESDAPVIDVRRIPLGDIDLGHEIRLDDRSGVVHHRRNRIPVRRMYSARVDSRQSDMTVTLYQGENAEEVLRFTSIFAPFP
jgi:hypothetical protein